MITITNKNIYFSEFPISILLSFDKIEKIDVTDIIRFLSDEVQLGESVTFKRLFEIVSENLNKFNEIFYSSLGGLSLDPFLQEIQNNTTELIESEHLEVHWFCDKFETELNISPSLHGVSNSDSYAIDFVSLNNIKDLIVKINNSVEIFDYNASEDEIIGDNKELKKINLGNKAFTLFDLFNAIFYEISFHGGPLEKKERWNDLEKSIDETEILLEDKKEEMEGFSFEKYLDELDSKDKYLVKHNELRCRVEEERIKDGRKLSKLKNCLLEKLRIYNEIQNKDNDLEHYYKKLTDLEYSMQILYGENEDLDFHRFWETPKCTCPKIDNIEMFPSSDYIFDEKCPIHKTIKNE